jgi:ketosteroid isomerase-like protein
MLKIGMTELDIVAEVDFQMKRHGSLGPSFTTSLYNTGPNHPILFGRRLQSWPRVLTAPVSVLFDFGAVHDGMCYDFGRTVSFGAPSAEQVRVHKLIMDSQRAGDRRAEGRRHHLRGGGPRGPRRDRGRGLRGQVPPPPGPCHRLGRARAAVPDQGRQTVVQEGMIFTIEPSIFQDGTFSARVEDCIVARPGGGEALTTGWQDLSSSNDPGRPPARATGGDLPEDRGMRMLLDTAAITAVLTDYCRFLDRMDLVALGRLFTADARVIYGPDPRLTAEGRDALVASLARMWRWRRTAHHLANPRVWVDGDTATSESAVHAWHEAADGTDAEIFGLYHDRLVRTADGWRIAERRMEMQGARGGFRVPIPPAHRAPHPRLDPAHGARPLGLARSRRDARRSRSSTRASAPRR